MWLHQLLTAAAAGDRPATETALVVAKLVESIMANPAAATAQLIEDNVTEEDWETAVHITENTQAEPATARAPRAHHFTDVGEEIAEIFYDERVMLEQVPSDAMLAEPYEVEQFIYIDDERETGVSIVLSQSLNL
jgi:hypothetical protein